MNIKTIQIAAGETINLACDYAVEVAKREQIIVVFQFNGTTVVTVPDSNWKDLVDQYHAELQENRTGVELIAEERQRQITTEGFNDSHDDNNKFGELINAAVAYQAHALYGSHKYRPPTMWPWDSAWWKPSEDTIRNLVKAGALIAAEIDRLKRFEKKI